MRTVVFSHGHADHHSRLEGITRGLGRSRLPLVLHPPLEHARRLTVTEHVHAFVGGMHLTGGLFEQIIPRTIEALNVIAPDVVVPGNCTGWKAVKRSWAGCRERTSKAMSARVSTSPARRLKRRSPEDQ